MKSLRIKAEHLKKLSLLFFFSFDFTPFSTLSTALLIQSNSPHFTCMLLFIIYFEISLSRSSKKINVNNSIFNFIATFFFFCVFFCLSTLFLGWKQKFLVDANKLFFAFLCRFRLLCFYGFSFCCLSQSSISCRISGKDEFEESEDV